MNVSRPESVNQAPKYLRDFTKHLPHTLDGHEYPCYILLYNFLVTYPNFMKFGDLSGINILKFVFSNFELVLAMSALFYDQVLFFVHVSCWNDKYIHVNISRI